MQFCRDPVTGSFKGNILHPGIAASGANILNSGERDIAQVPAKRKVAQRDAGMIIHMHLCAAAVAGKILVISLKRTGKADHSPAGYRQTGGG